MAKVFSWSALGDSESDPLGVEASEARRSMRWCEEREPRKSKKKVIRADASAMAAAVAS